VFAELRQQPFDLDIAEEDAKLHLERKRNSVAQPAASIVEFG
jgi:hypothetical protein